MATAVAADPASVKRKGDESASELGVEEEAERCHASLLAVTSANATDTVSSSEEETWKMVS